MKSTSIFFLLVAVLFMEAGGLISVYKLEQKIQQLAMRNKIGFTENDYETLILTPLEFKSARINHNEIFYKGNLYDVYSVNYNDQSVVLKVVNDNMEKQIAGKIKHDSQKNKHKRRHNTCKVFQFTFICNHPQETYTETGQPILAAKYSPCVVSFRVSDIITPPPDRV